MHRARGRPVVYRHVARLLSEAAGRRGVAPQSIQCDNGTEFTSTALDHWAYWNKVHLDFQPAGQTG